MDEKSKEKDRGRITGEIVRLISGFSVEKLIKVLDFLGKMEDNKHGGKNGRKSNG